MYLVMSSIKNDPRNYPPEPGSEKENPSDNQNSSANSKNKSIVLYFLNFQFLR
jgi:hypothetical protein